VSSFLALAAYVAFDAVKALVNREPPEASHVGIALAALSLVVVPLLRRRSVKWRRGSTVALSRPTRVRRASAPTCRLYSSADSR
jgi:hypothetical protein